MDSNSSTPNSKSKVIYGDRFIPSRIGSNFSLFKLPSSKNEGFTPYAAALRSVLFASPPSTPDILESFGSHHASISSTRNGNIFRYKSEIKRFSSSSFEVEDCFSGVVDRFLETPRNIICSPYRVLEAPALQDDYHLNLLDWSSNNVMAVGLESCVFLWNACSARVTKLCDVGDADSVCSIGWSQCGTHLAVGTDSGKVQIWDASQCRRIRTMKGHCSRVGALAWCSSMLSSGSRDKSILHRDVRTVEDYVIMLKGHKSEVCGMKWSYNNHELASGGNDDRLFIWNHHSTQPVLKLYEHATTVKAIAWSPHRHGLLASGGGSTDQCIRFWNTNTNTHLSCVDTGSQVCNLAWSKNVNELVSTHGYPQNDIIVWRYPTKSKIATLSGHMSGVLYMAVSPDGQTIVTGAADEKLMSWNVFPPSKFKLPKLQ